MGNPRTPSLAASSWNSSEGRATKQRRTDCQALDVYAFPGWVGCEGVRLRVYEAARLSPRELEMGACRVVHPAPLKPIQLLGLQGSVIWSWYGVRPWAGMVLGRVREKADLRMR